MNNIEWIENAKEVQTYLYKLEKASLSVGELFYENLNLEAVQVLETYLKGYFDIARAFEFIIESGEELNSDLKPSLTPYLEIMNGHMSKIQKFVAEERLVELADFLKYEIAEEISKIDKQLKEFL